MRTLFAQHRCNAYRSLIRARGNASDCQDVGEWGRQGAMSVDKNNHHSTPLAAVVGAAFAAQQIPLELKENLPDRGRGLFATTPIPSGTILYTATPAAVVPDPNAKPGSVCLHCLSQMPSGTPGNKRFCSDACETSARSGYYAIQSRLDLSHLEAYCRQKNLIFPLLACRLALTGLEESRRHRQGLPIQSSVGLIDNLCGLEYDPDHIPSDWTETHRLFGAALAEAASEEEEESVSLETESAKRYLSLQWWCDTIGRLHLNCFRIDRMPNFGIPGQGFSFEDLNHLASAAVLASSGGGFAKKKTTNPDDDTASNLGKAGSAVYFVPSFFNHACEPSVDVFFPLGGSTMKLVARKDIDAGEEATITYIDSSQSLEARQRLFTGYGFRCRCWICLQEEEEEADDGRDV